MIGTILDKYEVLQKVGEGGMATVYRGRHTTLDRDVAIKVLHPHLSSSTRNRKRFAREARAIEHLRHDNILEIYDYSGLDTGECYIITEYVEGDTLGELIERAGRLPSEVVCMLGCHLADALEYAHQSSILHRDLKPDNIMIRYDGTVKLMDFGIARFLDESQVTLTGALVGSPAFMSPEQAQELELDRRSDLFSLGTVLFRAVTGHLPFPGSNPSLILKNVIEGNRPTAIELAPDMSATLSDVIEQLMASNPDDRFVDASHVRQALEDCLAEVGLGPDEPAWSLHTWVLDPSSYEERLEAHLRDNLVERGRSALESGDHLQALRLFNRMLSIDEENSEVLALVGSLHAETSQRSYRLPVLLAVPVLLLVIGGIALSMGLAPRQVGEAPSPVQTQNEEPDQPASEEPVVLPPQSPMAAPDTEAQPQVPAEPVEHSPNAMRAPVKRRPPPSADTKVPAPAVDAPGFVKIRADRPAEIYRDGKRLASTLDPGPIELPAGRHELVVQSQLLKPLTVIVEVPPGETVNRRVHLEPKPATVSIPSAFDATCEVQLDGKGLGTAGALGYRIAVERPDRPGHRIDVRCGEQKYEHVWSGVVIPEDTFPVQPSP